MRLEYTFDIEVQKTLIAKKGTSDIYGLYSDVAITKTISGAHKTIKIVNIPKTIKEAEQKIEKTDLPF